MRIFRYWHICTEKNGELTVHFKAGSNESLEDAVSLAEEKRKVWRCCYEQLPGALEAAAALRAKLKGGPENEYEAPICEEIIETIDRIFQEQITEMFFPGAKILTVSF